MSTESTLDGSRDEEILRAAFDVFTEKGFHDATMLDVAKRARASKATLYGRFAGKEALFKALVAWGTRQGAEALSSIAADETPDPLAALNRYATRLLSQMLQPEKLALFRIAVAEGARLPEVGAIYSNATRDHGVALGRKLAARLIEARIVQIDEPEAFGHAFMGLLQGELFTRALLGVIPPPSEAEIEAHAHAAMSRLVRAFAPAG